MGRSEKRSIESHLGVILLHLLKWQYQPNGRDNSWRASILEHRKRIRRDITDSPSLRRYPGEVLAEEYESGRLAASGETKLPETVLDPDFRPEAPQE